MSKTKWIAHPDVDTAEEAWDHRYTNDIGISVAGHGFDNIQDFYKSGASIVTKLASIGIHTRNKTVAEYGCGPGRLISHIDAISRTGYDISQVALDQGREFVPNVDFVLIDPYDPAIRYHDIIFSYLVLQHNPKHVAIKIARLLIERSNEICVLDFPKYDPEQEAIVSDKDTWTSRTYKLSELERAFPDVEIVDLGDSDRWYIIAKK